MIYGIGIDVLEARRRTSVLVKVPHGQHVLHSAGRSGHRRPALPGLQQHVVLVRGQPSRRVQLYGPASLVGGLVQTVDLHRDGRPVVFGQIDAGLLTGGYHPPDPGGQAVLQYGLDGLVVSALAEVDVLVPDAPGYAGVQIRIVGHFY